MQPCHSPLCTGAYRSSHQILINTGKIYVTLIYCQKIRKIFHVILLRFQCPRKDTVADENVHIIHSYFVKRI